MKRYVTGIAVLLLVCGLLAGCGEDRLETGLALLEEENYEEAIGEFEEAVGQEQDLAEAYRGIGIARWELEEYAASKDAFVSALENGAKETASLYNFLGGCEMQLSNPRGAVLYYDLGLACEDCDGQLRQEMRFNQIAAYEQCEEWDEAREALARYLTDYPDDERAAKESEFLETQ